MRFARRPVCRSRNRSWRPKVDHAARGVALALDETTPLEPFTLRISAALLLTLAFVPLTAAVVARQSPVKRFDERVVAALARGRSDRIDRVVGPLSMFATEAPLAIQGAITFVLLLAMTDGSPPLHFALAAAGSAVLSELGKRVVARERPAVPHLIGWLRGTSYPSGDLLTATSIYLTIAVIVTPYLPDRTASEILSAIVGIMLALLASCRVYAGVHYPSDVVGGVLLGAAWALFVSACFI